MSRAIADWKRARQQAKASTSRFGEAPATGDRQPAGGNGSQGWMSMSLGSARQPAGGNGSQGWMSMSLGSARQPAGGNGFPEVDEHELGERSPTRSGEYTAQGVLVNRHRLSCLNSGNWDQKVVEISPMP